MGRRAANEQGSWWAAAWSQRLPAMLLLVTACGEASSSGTREQPAPAPSSGGPAPLATTAAIDPSDPLAGTWWILSNELPIRGFLLNITAAESGADSRTARWVSFDWRATSDPEQLVRRSQPVGVELRTEGETLVLEGPSPMLNDKGQPNGQRGAWRIELRATHLPNEPSRYQGSAVHTELTEPGGLPVSMERSFRGWTRD